MSYWPNILDRAHPLDLIVEGFSIPTHEKIAALRRELKAQMPKPKRKRPYKGSKAAKKASRRRRQ